MNIKPLDDWRRQPSPQEHMTNFIRRHKTAVDETFEIELHELVASYILAALKPYQEAEIERLNRTLTQPFIVKADNADL